ncbi:dedA family protein [Cyanobium sp. NS01]|nr:dedA family protein [Cyanobium sp. NS01]
MPPLLAWFPDLPQLIDRAAQLDPWHGYGAIALAMLLENLIPPIPSEVILPLAGYGVARGDLVSGGSAGAAAAVGGMAGTPWRLGCAR